MPEKNHPKKNDHGGEPIDTERTAQTVSADQQNVAAERQPELPEKPSKTNGRPKGGSGGIIWALFLIFLGIMFLLNTTGIVPWNVWAHIWRFWPVFLILAGLQVIFGGSFLSSFTIGLISLIIFVIMGLIGIASTNSTLLKDLHINLPSVLYELGSGDVGEKISKTFTVDDSQYQNIESRKLDLQIGAAEFSLESDESSDFLNLNASYYENFGEPKLAQSKNAAALELVFEQENNDGSLSFPNGAPKYDFLIGKDALATDVTIDLGAGKGTVDIANARLEKLNITVGAGDLSVRINKDAVPVHTTNIKLGVGNVMLELPKDIGYRLTYKLGLGNIKVNGKSVAKIGSENETTESSNYSTAAIKMDISADVGVGNFELKQ